MSGRQRYERRGHLMRDNWIQFAERILPEHASAVQRQEMRRAFYAGAMMLLMDLAELGDEDVSEDAGAEVLEATRREVEAFYARIGTPEEGR